MKERRSSSSSSSEGYSKKAKALVGVSCGVSFDLHVTPHVGVIFIIINSWPQVLHQQSSFAHNIHFFTRFSSLFISNPFFLFSCSPSVRCTVTKQDNCFYYCFCASLVSCALTFLLSPSHLPSTTSHSSFLTYTRSLCSHFLIIDWGQPVNITTSVQ